MALEKLLIKRITGDWNNKGTLPIVNTWGDEEIPRVNVVRGDDVLVCLHALEELTINTFTDLVFTGAVKLRAAIRAAETPTSVMYGIQTSYNQGNYAAGEDLSAGKVTWLTSIGTVAYNIDSLVQGTKTFYVTDDWASQFTAADTFVISGSTGNDGTYTVVSATYVSGTDLTGIVVSETISSAVADGTISHSALQSATFNSDGYINAYIELSWEDANGKNQTVLPTFPCRIHNEIDQGQTGIGSGAPITYMTSTEIAAAYEKFYANQNISTTATLVDIRGMRFVYCNTTGGGFTVTLPATVAATPCSFVIMNIGTNTLTINPNSRNIQGAASNVTIESQYGTMFVTYDSTDATWKVPDFFTP